MDKAPFGVQHLMKTLLNPTAPLDERSSAARQLSACEHRPALKALIAVTSDAQAPAELAGAAGRSLAQICVRRRQDLDDLVVAAMSRDAYLAYDGEVARLQSSVSNVTMRRGQAGSGR